PGGRRRVGGTPRTGPEAPSDALPCGRCRRTGGVAPRRWPSRTSGRPAEHRSGRDRRWRRHRRARRGGFRLRARPGGWASGSLRHGRGPAPPARPRRSGRGAPPASRGHWRGSPFLSRPPRPSRRRTSRRRGRSGSREILAYLAQSLGVGGRVDFVRPHDQGVFVHVVGLANADRDHPETSIERLRGGVGHPHLEGEALGAPIDGAGDELEDQAGADPGAAVARVDRHRRDVGFLSHAHQAAVPDDAAFGVERHQIDAVLGGELVAKDLLRPRRGIGAPLQLHHIAEVLLGHRDERDAAGRVWGRGHGHPHGPRSWILSQLIVTSGSRRYKGRTSSGGGTSSRSRRPAASSATAAAVGYGGRPVFTRWRPESTSTMVEVSPTSSESLGSESSRARRPSRSTSSMALSRTTPPGTGRYDATASSPRRTSITAQMWRWPVAASNARASRPDTGITGIPRVAPRPWAVAT